MSAERTLKIINFRDVQLDNAGDDYLIIRLGGGKRVEKYVQHTLPELDRCCKLNGKKVQFDGFDNIPRISCDLPEDEFVNKYLNKREPVMLVGCQDKWPAKDWTFNGKELKIIICPSTCMS
jgi:hypothetical protein